MMLIKKNNIGNQHPCHIPPAKIGNKQQRNKADARQHVEHLRNGQCTGNAKADRNGIQAFILIEFNVLA
ncbi:hypothetical protein D3C84_1269000 [compost metagenome]